MGGKGSSAPPPPPDYSQEIAREQNRIEGRYQREADSYNQNVNRYNELLSASSQAADQLSNRVSGLGVADATPDQLSTFREQVSNLESNAPDTSIIGYTPYDANTPQIEPLGEGKVGEMTSTAFNKAFGNETFYDEGQFVQGRPSFKSQIQHGTYGAIPLNPPSLSNPNRSLRQEVLGDVESIQSQLDRLEEERQRERESIRNFRNQMLSDADVMSTSLNQLDIGNEQGINQAERELAEYRSQLRGFSSPILDQVRPDGFNEIQDRIGSFSESIEDLRNRRQQEAQRIDQFESGLLDTADQYRDQISDLTIADADQIGSLEQSIQDQLRQANRFESPLNYDFSNELSEVRGLSSRINELQQQREAEQQRIAQTRSQLEDLARSARSAVGNTDIYSAAGIDAIEDQLNTIRGDVSGFESPLQADFSNVQSALSEADAALAQLRERRSDRLSGLASQIAPATQGLDDVDLYNESAFRERQSQLSDLENELARFSGGQVSDINAQIADARSQIDARLQALTEYRSGVEQQAQELLNRVQEASYYGTSDLGGDRESLEALQAEAELYNAQQALDEIDKVANRLNSERQRLEADAEAVAARERAAREQLESQIGSSGVPQFQNFAMVDPLTTSQFAQRFITPQSEDEDEQTDSLANRGFSSALGVIRA
jgi:hypothetical protein